MSSNSNRHGEWPLDAKIYIGDLGNDATRYELEDSRDAEDAVKELDGTRICGRRVKVQMSKPRSGGTAEIGTGEGPEIAPGIAQGIAPGLERDRGPDLGPGPGEDATVPAPATGTVREGAIGTRRTGPA